MSLNRNIPKGFIWCSATYTVVQQDECKDCPDISCRKHPNRAKSKLLQKRNRKHVEH